jgi:signal transduction histidine kinase
MVAQFDITASREAEALQNRLVSDVSHEFKTPLTSIRGYAETLFDELDAEDPDSAFQRRSLERILAATTHLEEVVRDLLDLGHLRETGGRLRREELDLGDVIRDAMGTLERQAAEKGVRIVVDLPSGPVRLRGDRGRLVRAMLNLLSNGLKYGAPGEPVRVEVSRTDDSWVVAVIDRGAGIAPEAVSHLFERFFRVDHGRSRDAGGTGLGLAIVREVAKAHGGDATVESKVGEGSVFRLRLPFGSDA